MAKTCSIDFAKAMRLDTNQVRDTIERRINERGFFLTDGALATCLEQRGLKLHDTLWSAELIRSAPKSIQQLHLDYLQAGADCITTATYQASFSGFYRAGFEHAEACEQFRVGVQLAVDARREFYASNEQASPLVAASVGPYGAALADGSEYHGEYGVSDHDLATFHRQRLTLLANTQADILAIETLPSTQETHVIVELLGDLPNCASWVSFSCRDGKHIADGTPIEQCVSLVTSLANVVAIGVNCTAPQYITELVQRIQPLLNRQQLIVYPNSGEQWDGLARCWHGSNTDFSQLAKQWYQAGARIIGGCCRTGPQEIRDLSLKLIS
jgi:homocysteine S-methyltransferase